MKLANNKPNSYERVSVDLGKQHKLFLINYAAKRRLSVSFVIRKLVAKLENKEIEVG